jgi:hypothetical protein
LKHGVREWQIYYFRGFYSSLNGLYEVSEMGQKLKDLNGGKGNKMIHEKLYKFQSEIGRLKKDRLNPHFKNSYVDINSVLDEIIPLLHSLKLFVTQPIIIQDGKNVLQTVIADVEDGTELTSQVLLPEGLDAQKTGSALTYFRRYSLVSMLGLQAVDDDGKAGSNPIKEKQVPTEEMVLEIEALMKGNAEFKQQWLNFLGVKSFDKASFAQLEKAIGQLS